MDEIKKIMEYVKRYKNFYSDKKYMNRFLEENPDVKEYANRLLNDEPWFETIANVIIMVSKGFSGKVVCKTCGKELSVQACKRGNRFYCSGGCKSKDLSRMQFDEQNRIRRESVYAVDLNSTVSDDLIEFFKVNGNRPTNEVMKKIMDFCQKDSKGAGLYNLINKNKDVDIYLTTLVHIHPWMKDKKRAYWFVKNGLYNGKTCKSCGKLLTYRQIKDDHEYCSRKCANTASEVKDKKDKTCIERYGFINPVQSEQVIKKRKATMIKRYGVENPSKVDEFKEKRKKTNLEKFGAEYYLASTDSKEKRVKTSIEKYGEDHPMKCEMVKKNLRASIKSKYGVDNVMELDDVRCKALSNGKYALYDMIVKRFSKYVIPLFTADEYVRVQNVKCMWKCVKCGTEFEDHRHGTNSGYRRGNSFPLCPVCYPPVSGFSNEEHDVLNFIKRIYNGQIIENTRKVIPPLELDMWIPEKNIAIEYDGSYWHSDVKGKGKLYHLNKTETCEKLGIHLIHIFEDEWNNKKEIVQDRIKSIFGLYQSRIFARKCIIRQISASDEKNFLEQNHLQGYAVSSIGYGLFHEGSMVAVMTFCKPRFNNHYDWELLRFSCAIGVRVVGGASKLLSYFRARNTGSIITYADRRYSNGNLYETLGFTRIGVTDPNYCYMKNRKRLSRYECQKHKLSHVLGDGFDPNLSENENMQINGWNRVYDCGNFVYAIH